MSGGCIGEMRRQIQAEINASVKYLAMGAHFAQDTVNRPGFAEFFFKSASEEREHATKLIEYLLMRTNLNSVGDLIKVNVSIFIAADMRMKCLKNLYSGTGDYILGARC